MMHADASVSVKRPIWGIPVLEHLIKGFFFSKCPILKSTPANKKVNMLR